MATHNLTLICGNAHPALGERLARELDVPISRVEITTFADGETKLHVSDDVRGKIVLVVQPTCAPVNDRLMVLALLADAARAAGAAHITGVVPY
ncbi:MAG TPA: ribose-phosphate pyrophosphokinase-like domain-containing protein, partial [Lacipirellulaceae bacterium]|nr:ribose-phosphate pyrophosphokinase-like domain-containing protein [Lacipirellulaceae bacterium]